MDIVKQLNQASQPHNPIEASLEYEYDMVEFTWLT
jgi:hypothetical protein